MRRICSFSGSSCLGGIACGETSLCAGFSGAAVPFCVAIFAVLLSTERGANFKAVKNHFPQVPPRRGCHGHGPGSCPARPHCFGGGGDGSGATGPHAVAAMSV